MNRNKCMKSVVFFLLVVLFQYQFFLDMPLKAYAIEKIDSISPSVPQGITSVNVTYTTIVLSWSKSYDNIQVKGYQLYRNGKKIISTSKTTYANTELIPGMKYVYSLRAYDAAGNISGFSNTLTVTTLNDFTNPSTPSLLNVFSVDYTSIKFQWDSSSDNVGIKGYEIFRNYENVGKTSNIFYCDKNLIPGKSYSYYVRSYDYAGNKSMDSNALNITTLKDTQKPTAPSGLKTKSVNGSSASIEWDASKDNVKIKGYYIYCNGVNVATTSRTHRSIRCSNGIGVYLIWVKAFDLADNVSDISNKLTIVIPKF